jgi:hypothetical protein
MVRKSLEEAGLPYQFLVVVELILYRRVDMDKFRAAATTASIAGAASYLFVSIISCYAAEAADVEPIPLGATLTGTATTSTSSATTTGVWSLAETAISNPMGDEPIKVVSGVPGWVLWPRNSAVAPREPQLLRREGQASSSSAVFFDRKPRI